MVYAADSDVFQFLEPWRDSSPDEPMQVNQVSHFFGLGMNIVFGVAIAVSMIALIMSGIKFVTARGDPKAKASAQQALTYSVVGFVLAIAAFTIKTIIFNVIGGNYGDLTNATPNF